MKKLLVISVFMFFMLSFSNVFAKDSASSMLTLVKGVYTSSPVTLNVSNTSTVKNTASFNSFIVPLFSGLAQRYQTYQDNLAKLKAAQSAKQKTAQQQQLGQASAALDGKYIDIDVSTQTLTAFQDKVAVYRFKISSGGPRTPTPLGTFKIRDKSLRAYSKKYNLYMPYWMGFTPWGHGIHELPEYPNGHKEGAASIGRAVSHGCVRLPVGNAATIYNWANVGDTVYVHK